MTYQHGKAPADAPVTWNVSTDKRGERQWNLSDFGTHVCVCYSEESADRVGRAFHLAKLAGEAAKIGDAAGEMHHASCLMEPCNHLEKAYADWLRRYDAAKGDA